MATKVKAEGGLVKNQGKPAKKASAKAKAAEAPATRGRQRRELDVERIAELRNTEPKTSWAEIATEMGTTVGKVIFEYEKSQLKKSDRVKVDPDDRKALGKAVVEMREVQKLSWGRIAMRLDISEAKARTAYADAARDPSKGERIGKGGRHAGATVTNIDSKRKPNPAKVAEAKASAKKKGAAAAEAAVRRPGRRRGAEATAEAPATPRKARRPKAEAEA